MVTEYVPKKAAMRSARTPLKCTSIPRHPVFSGCAVLVLRDHANHEKTSLLPAWSFESGSKNLQSEQWLLKGKAQASY